VARTPFQCTEGPQCDRYARVTGRRLSRCFEPDLVIFNPGGYRRAGRFKPVLPAVAVSRPVPFHAFLPPFAVVAGAPRTRALPWMASHFTWVCTSAAFTPAGKPVAGTSGLSGHLRHIGASAGVCSARNPRR
jgi:hypothetical protein